MVNNSNSPIIGVPRPEEFDTNRMTKPPILKSGILHQIFVPVTVPIGKEVASILVQAVNQASQQILPQMAKDYPDRIFSLLTRQVIVTDGKLQQNILMLMDLIVD